MSSGKDNDDITNFVNYLDGYKKKKEINMMDIYNILYSIDYNFYINNYGDTNYAGNKVYNPPNNNKSNDKLKDRYVVNEILRQIKIESENNNGDVKNFFCENNTKNTNLKSYNFFDFENIQNNTNKLNTDSSNNITPNTPSEQILEKIKVTIDVNVKELSDLLEILNNYEYDENTEYNIDLKSLSNIKTELTELNNMIGMESLKQAILNQLLYFIQELHIEKINKDDNTIITSEFKHTVICGPPGTGKTEIAKIIGRMYSKLGILKNNIFKKVTRNDLVAGYLGQTAIKTKKVIEDCLGGVLFIDEAYSLANFNDVDSFSKECLDILCESLSDHKNDLMVIIAGYEKELDETFFMANRGLESRFIWRFKIDEYSPKELNKIFMKKVNETNWYINDDEIPTEKWFEKNKENFRNYGRDMELLFTYTKICHSKRIYGKPIEERKKISMGDLENGLEMLKNNRKQKDKRNPILDSLYI